MRQMILAASSILVALTISGCTTVSESEYKLGSRYLAEDASIKREVINDCIADRRRESGDEQRTYAALINVSVANYPQAFCRRLINAVANGRLTYGDIRSLDSGSQDYSKIIRILQGK